MACLPAMIPANKRRAIWISLSTVALALGVYWVAFSEGGGRLTVNNALVTGRTVDLIAPLTGVVTLSTLQPYTWVRQGDLVLVLDQAQYDARLQDARQRLQTALLARVNACLLAAVQDSERQRAFAAVQASEAELARAVELNKMGFLSAQGLEDRNRAFQESVQTRETRRLETSRLRSDAQRPLMLSEGISQAVADLRQVLASRSKHFIRVPRDSFVYGPVAHVGDTVAEGSVLARLVPQGPTEVEVLVLETQVARLQLGTEALVHFDAVAGPDRYGTVVAITPAIAAAFAPVVRPNMDSNWIKVNQRVPVVVRMEALASGSPPPPLGSSSEVVFFPGGTRAAAVAAPAPAISTTPYTEDLDGELLASVDAIVRTMRPQAIAATAGVPQCTQSIDRLWSSWRPK